MTRNKTIEVSEDDRLRYLPRCLTCETDFRGADSGLILGDCLEVMPLLPEKSVDLLIADPPYNLSKKFDGMSFSASVESEYAEYTRRWLAAAAPLLKNTASVYVCCDWRSSGAVGAVLGEFFTVRNRITWQREKGRGAAKNWKNNLEDVWFATVSDDYVFNLPAVKIRRAVRAPYRENGEPKDWFTLGSKAYRDTCPGNFWDDLTVPFWSMKENTTHPTQKPEKLVAKLILASSDPGGVVFDPFAGSGTTAVTAKKLGRRFFAVERSENYCILAQKRLELAETDKTIQGYSDGVFWERNSK
ncbi:MAG: site-specific DNA-methyltransferase [Clostridia bacterium]|nr:site-specific DNA-methyltransferase [Clostridia bacterium]